MPEGVLAEFPTGISIKATADVCVMVEINDYRLTIGA
jgi:hypothetical protein